MPKFRIGELVTTRGVFDLSMENKEFQEFIMASLKRYADGDWGDTDKEDCVMNDEALKSGDSRLLAVYKHPEHEDWKIWIITEWDRSATTILFPSEY